MREEWKPVPGHPGYLVSNLGQITGKRGGIRKQQIANGYRVVNLDSRTRRVHHLVLAAFVGERPSGMVARHLNDDRNNNRLSNLAYGTHRQNQLDCVRNGHHPNANKVACRRGHGFTAFNTGTHNNGKRYCLACNRAMVAVSRSEEPVDLQKVADEKFDRARVLWLAAQKTASAVAA